MTAWSGLGIALALLVAACSTGGTTSPDGSAPPSASPPADAGSDGSAAVTISTSEFDTACGVDADCGVVFQGNVCNPCRCENAAIAARDLDRYRSTLDARAASCAKRPGCAADCAMPNAYCVGARCTASVKAPDAGK